MKAIVAGCVIALGLSSVAVAAPTKLSDRQLDSVTAGALTLTLIGGPLPPISFPIGRLPPQPIGPPTINPGGPILISCVIGAGCTTRPY
jgi:hypothetical protein